MWSPIVAKVVAPTIPATVAEKRSKFPHTKPNASSTIYYHVTSSVLRLIRRGRNGKFFLVFASVALVSWRRDPHQKLIVSARQTTPERLTLRFQGATKTNDPSLVKLSSILLKKSTCRRWKTQSQRRITSRGPTGLTMHDCKYDNFKIFLRISGVFRRSLLDIIKPFSTFI